VLFMLLIATGKRTMESCMRCVVWPFPLTKKKAESKKKKNRGYLAMWCGKQFGSVSTFDRVSRTGQTLVRRFSTPKTEYESSARTNCLTGKLPGWLRLLRLPFSYLFCFLQNAFGMSRDLESVTNIRMNKPLSRLLYFDSSYVIVS